MIIQVSSETDINWQATGYQKIADNVANILKTRISEIPYMRDMGISPEYIDMPFTEIKGEIISDAIEAITAYESRATVKEIDVEEASQDGDIIIRVVIEVG